MSHGQPIRRVSSGPPWWLWVLLVLVTSVVLVAVVATSIPEDPQEIYEAATSAIESRDKESFTKNLTTLRRFPNYAAHVSFLEGKLAANETRDIKALDFFQAALENEELKPVALEEIGKCQTRMGEFTAAIKTYEQAIQAASGSSQSARVSLANLYYSVGALTLAEATLGEVLELDDTNSDARSLRGAIRMETGRLQQAVDDFQVLLATPGGRASADPKVVENCAVSLIRLENVEALQTFYSENKSLISDPYLKARLMLAVGDLDSKDEIMAESDKIDINPVKHGKFKATLALAEGEIDKAVAEIESVFTITTRDLDAFELAKQIFEKTEDAQKLGIVKENLDEFSEVNAEFVEVVTEQCANVTNFEARIKAAELQKQMGDIPSAQKWYSMAAMLAPEKTASAYESIRAIYDRLPMFVQFPLPAKTDVKVSTDDDKATEDTEEKAEQTESDNATTKSKSDKPEAKAAESDEKKVDAATDAEPKKEVDGDDPKPDSASSNEAVKVDDAADESSKQEK